MFPYPNDPNVKVIGKCSICGGRVTVPAVWWSIVPPKPTCERCGAVYDEEAYLPTLPMKPAERPNWRHTTTSIPKFELVPFKYTPVPYKSWIANWNLPWIIIM